MLIVIFVVAFIVAIILVNLAQRLWMKMIGADMMAFSGKKKFIAIVVIWLILAGITIQFLGVEF